LPNISSRVNYDRLGLQYELNPKRNLHQEVDGEVQKPYWVKNKEGIDDKKLE
jgi:hypothetical protein